MDFMDGNYRWEMKDNLYVEILDYVNIMFLEWPANKADATGIICVYLLKEIVKKMDKWIIIGYMQWSKGILIGIKICKLK